jgi:outer membrane protein
MRLFSIFMASALAFAVPAAAQDRSFSFALGAGVGAVPEYMGSNDYAAAAFPTFTFGSLNWGRVNVGNGVRGVPEPGFSVTGAYRLLSERSVEDSPELVGLADIDTAVELGLGLKYEGVNWNIFGEVRKGVTGHSGVTGTIGSDYIMRPNDRWKIAIGPRMNFGDDEYANTYFGVDSATPNFAAYTATGGAMSGGVQLTGSYYLNDKWSLDGGVSYEKLLGDAADSPITMAGSDDQWRIAIGVSRIFNLNF